VKQIWVPTAKIDVPELKRKNNLRVINRGTRYDIIGQLTSLARHIEQGDYGDVRHVIVGVCSREGNQVCVTTLGFGNQTVPEAAYTTDMMKKRLCGE